MSGGENVYPEEVEEALANHKGVKDVAVIGVEDDDFGERLKAFVVKSGSVSQKALRAGRGERVARTQAVGVGGTCGHGQHAGLAAR